MRNHNLDRFLTISLAFLLLLIFGLIVLHAPMIVFVGTHVPSIDLLFKAWKEILMGICLILTALLLTSQKRWTVLAKDRIVQVVFAYATLHAITLVLFHNSAQATAAGLLIDLRYILFFVLVYILLRFYPAYRRLFMKVGLAGAIIVLGFGVLQVFFLPKDVLTVLGYGKETITPYLTVDENHDFIRINSTLRGPNPLGAYALIVLSVLTALIVTKGLVNRKSKQFFAINALLIGALVCMVASYSRSAVIGVVISLLVVAGVNVWRKLRLKHWLVIGGIVVIGLVGFLAIKDSSFVSNVVLHENPQGGSSVSSNEGHAESLKEGVVRMAGQPLGAGIGSTGSASLTTDKPLIIENQYLYIAHEIGWLGLIIFLVLWVMVLRHLWLRRRGWLSLGVFASGIGLGVIGLLLPVWVDDTVSIIWWGLAAICLSIPIDTMGDKKEPLHEPRKTSPRQ
jgi:hypothetical protein